MGVGVSEERCLARAREYSEWCGNKMYQQIIATFTPTGATRAYPPDDVVEAASRAAEGAGGDALGDSPADSRQEENEESAPGREHIVGSGADGRGLALAQLRSLLLWAAMKSLEVAANLLAPLWTRLMTFWAPRRK